MVCRGRENKVCVKEDVGAAGPRARYVVLSRGVEEARRGEDGGGDEFQEARRERVRVRRNGGGLWWSESIQVAESCVTWRRPKWECCHVRTRRELLGVPGRGGAPLLARLVHWLG